jgi:hypothetical protein
MSGDAGAMRRSLLPKVVCAALTLSAAILITEPASAEKGAHHFISPGLAVGFSAHIEDPVQGILGGELDYTYYPWDPLTVGFGGFAQVQTMGIDHIRVGFGPQFNLTVFGTELGVYIEDEDEDSSTTMGLQVAPFVSIGFMSLAFRLGVPFYRAGAAPAHAVDMGLLITLKWPIPLGGDYLPL